MRLTVSPEHVWRRRDRTFVIDARPEDEYARGHVPGARCVPREQLLGQVERLRGQPLELAVIAADGPSTQDAAAVLQDAVDVAVWEVRGGLEAWLGAELPLA